jgi:hypothetical protein
VPRGACVLAAAATWSRSVPGTFPDLSSGTVRYEQVNLGRSGHGCAPVRAGRAGGATDRADGAPGRVDGAPGWADGAPDRLAGRAVQAAASRVSGNTVAAIRAVRVACGAMRMLIPPAHRSGTGPFTLPERAAKRSHLAGWSTGANGGARYGGARRVAGRRAQQRPGTGPGSPAGRLRSPAAGLVHRLAVLVQPPSPGL